MWKTFTDLFDFFPLTALVSIFVKNDDTSLLLKS